MKTSRVLTGMAAMAGAALLAAPTHALIIDTNGAAGGGLRAGIETFDWLPGSAYSIGGNDAVASAIGLPGASGSTTFSVVTHASLGSMTSSGGAVIFTPGDTQGGAARQEYTVVLRFDEVVTLAVPGIATFAFSDSPADYLEIWYDDGSVAGSVAADPLSGDGYNDGRLILRADVTGASGNFSSTDNFMDAAGLGGAITSLPGGPDGFLDEGDLDEAGGNNYPGVSTIAGNGVSSVFASVIDFDGTFFQNNPGEIMFDILTTTQTLPFGSVNPSDAFETASSGLASGATRGVAPETSFAIGAGVPGAGIGMVNGHLDPIAILGVHVPGAGPSPFALGGPDVMFQTDASNDFSGPEVPEPLTATLGVMSLGALSALARRRR